ncbi:MAG: CoA transferase [Novosphingobium sp.]|nr:CoA transferase [Novosphingobium sp.]
MQDVLAGIRVVEVASWTFVPSSGAVLAEWGAQVIKIEEPEHGDPQRGLISTAIIPKGGANFMYEIPNRGKRSVGLNIASESGRELLYRMVENADVFVTNYLPDVRQRLGIDLEQIRARNPAIIYARGSGNGPRGPEAGRGGFDSATYWARSGIANALTEPEYDWPPGVRPGFGDLMGGLALAGGISAALVKRERTGVPSEVDVSLLSLGMWNLGPDIASAKLFEDVERPAFDRDAVANPLVGFYPTADGRFVSLMLFQDQRYWPDLCEHLGRPELIADPRFADSAARYENRREIIRLLREIFASASLDEWRERLKTLKGVWSPVQTPREVHDDQQAIANGYFQDLACDNGAQLAVATNPVQFDKVPPKVARAPAHGEHTDEVLLELGLSYDEILAHKAEGAVL